MNVYLSKREVAEMLVRYAQKRDGIPDGTYDVTVYPPTAFRDNYKVQIQGVNE